MKNKKTIKANNITIRDIIREEIEKHGANCDLNHIDVSDVTDMSYMFSNCRFNGDISRWDVSNVTDMYRMFWNTPFNGDISKWDVSKVEDMEYMFGNSKFNGDISKWNVSNVKYMDCMFANSCFDNINIASWNINENVTTNSMLLGCPLENKLNIRKITVFEPKKDKQ